MKLLHSLVLACALAVTTPSWAAGVNINTADAATIEEALSGVGRVRAEAIVEYRSRNGPFKHLEDLMNVKGIGVRTLEINRDDISLN